MLPLLLAFVLLASTYSSAQSTPRELEKILSQPIQSSDVVEFQLQQYVTRHAPKLPAPRSKEQWLRDAERLRAHILDDVILPGWRKAWIDARPRFETAGSIETKKGYCIRKFRYEIVPGFWSTALLYEPEPLEGKVPAILNVYGHLGQSGKATEFVQKRCINFALQGMITLTLEWIGMGELSHPEDDHDFLADLDLVGANGLGLFYLGMRRGLDYLYQDPNVDRTRIGMTGLSGGGWQTIVLSSLDPRVSVAVPVAGFGDLKSNVLHPWDTDQLEEDAADLREGEDYPWLVALRAPRPTLLIYNANDDCCFRAPFVKPYVYEDIKPFFGLFGKADLLGWHVNTDPGTHNYQLDNRLQAYRFFHRYFGLPPIEEEVPAGQDLLSGKELAVGVPRDNLTIVGLAQRFAQNFRRSPIPSDAPARASWAKSERVWLKAVVRYTPEALERTWTVRNTWDKGVETLSYSFGFDNGLSATAVWGKAIASPDNAPATIILNDKGKQAAAAEVSDRVNRGEQALAADLVFTGDAAPPVSPQDSWTPHGTKEYVLLLNSVGVRPLGIETGQLITLAKWLAKKSATPVVRLEATGIRSQLVALVAAALEPALFSEVVTRNGMRSLGYLLDVPVPYGSAPDLFCLDFYKDFDVDRLATIAEPAKIVQQDFARAEGAQK
jgi:dienelactone hydrolase